MRRRVSPWKPAFDQGGSYAQTKPRTTSTAREGLLADQRSGAPHGHQNSLRRSEQPAPEQASCSCPPPRLPPSRRTRMPRNERRCRAGGPGNASGGNRSRGKRGARASGAGRFRACSRQRSGGSAGCFAAGPARARRLRRRTTLPITSPRRQTLPQGKTTSTVTLQLCRRTPCRLVASPM